MARSPAPRTSKAQEGLPHDQNCAGMQGSCSQHLDDILSGLKTDVIDLIAFPTDQLR